MTHEHCRCIIVVEVAGDVVALSLSLSLLSAPLSHWLHGAHAQDL